MFPPFIFVHTTFFQNKKDEEAALTPVQNKTGKKKGKAPRFGTPKVHPY